MRAGLPRARRGPGSPSRRAGAYAPGVQALSKLRGRLAELADLGSVEMLSEWDLRVTMPREGASARAEQLGTLARLTHERATVGGDRRVAGRARRRGAGGLDRDIVRLARRDWERARGVPAELAVELAQAAPRAGAWQAAVRTTTSRPSRRRSSATSSSRAPTGMFRGGAGEPYEALLGDYDFGLRTEECTLFGELAERLPPLVAEAHPYAAARAGGAGRGAADRRRRHPAPSRRRRRSWRVDVSTHPFTAWMSRRDSA